MKRRMRADQLNVRKDSESITLRTSPEIACRVGACQKHQLAEEQSPHHNHGHGFCPTGLGHQVLRQGATSSRRLPFEPQTPESVAEAILRAIETGEAEIVLGHTPAPAD